MAKRNKPRAWDNLKGQVPKDPAQVELTPRMRQVLAEKDKRAALAMADLEGEWLQLEEEEEFEDRLKAERSIKFDALRKVILEKLEEVKRVAGTDMWRGADMTFSPKNILNVHVTDYAAFMRWIRDTDQDHLRTVPNGRIKSIVHEAMNTDLAAALSPAQRAELKPGAPGSGAPPPGIAISLHETVHPTSTKRKSRPADPDGDDVPF